MTPQRVSRQEIENRRKDRSVRFLLTGGTGFLGSHIGVALLRRGHQVRFLARSDKLRSAEERVNRLLDWFDLPAAARQGVRVVEGDITRPGMGIDPAIRPGLLEDVDEIIHCASNTAFGERQRSEVERVNIDGLSSVLDFAAAGRAYFFHHVSTAFVAGKTAGLCLEEPVEDREFHNVYEKTKCLGEKMVLTACRRSGLELTITRPAIVYGDSRTGRSLLFNAVYYPVRTALFLKDLFEKDILERGGKKAGEMNVRLDGDGSIYLPLRIGTAAEGGLNLVSVDYFTDAFLALMDGAPQGGIFHIVNGKRKRVEDLIEYTRRLFRLNGIASCSLEELGKSPMNALEILYERTIEAYGPYMKDRRIFDASKSRPILERHGVVCPEFDYDVFARCMTFAVDSGWGERLFIK